MGKKFLLITIIIICQIGCANQTNNNPDAKNTYEDTLRDTCITKNLNTKLLKKILDIPNFDKYYKPYLLSDNKLFIKTNSYFNSNLAPIVKFGKPVILIDSTSISDKKIMAYIDIKNITEHNDTVYIFLKYPIQGIGINALFYKKNCDWELINYKLWEN